MTHAVINGEYVTFKHIKTRKVVVLEVEVPEEMFQDVITKLGMPVGGQSKPVAVCLLKEGSPERVDSSISQKTEGEKLRTRSVLLCKDEQFQNYAEYTLPSGAYEDCGLSLVYQRCNIKSRSELATNIDAQNKFKQLLENFNQWKLEQKYSDNLDRV